MGKDVESFFAYFLLEESKGKGVDGGLPPPPQTSSSNEEPFAGFARRIRLPCQLPILSSAKHSSTPPSATA